MRKEYFYVILSGILSGTIIVFGQLFSNFGLSLFEISTLPFILIVLFLIPLMTWNKQYRMKWQLLPWLIAYGLIGTFAVLTEFGAVLLGVPVAIVVFLLYSAPLWTVIFTYFFMNERITRKDIIASFIVIIGVFILANPLREGHFSLSWGILVAILGGVFLSLWVIFGSLLSKKGSHPMATKFAESFFMLIFLFVLYPFGKIFILNEKVMAFSFSWSFNVWIFILIFALFSQTINHLLFFTGVKKIPSIHGQIILLIEPIIASILAYFLFGQMMTWNITLGGILILVSNYLIIKNN